MNKIHKDYCQWVQRHKKDLHGYFISREYNDRAVYLNKLGEDNFEVIEINTKVFYHPEKLRSDT